MTTIQILITIAGFFSFILFIVNTAMLKYYINKYNELRIKLEALQTLRSHEKKYSDKDFDGVYRLIHNNKSDFIKQFDLFNKEIFDLHKKDSNLQTQINNPNSYAKGKVYKHGKYEGCIIVDYMRHHRFNKDGEVVTLREPLINMRDRLNDALSRYQ